MGINRRRFLTVSGLLAVFGRSTSLGRAFAADKTSLPKSKIRRLTSGPKHHFFGYYGICPWSKSQSHIVCLESDFQDHFPAADEPASIGLVDCETGKFSRISQTNAWNLQQGAMLHWNPLNPDNEIIYNDRRDNEIVSVILDVHSGRKRIMPRAVSAVSNNGRYALSLTYGRLARLRKTVGYLGTTDPNPNSPAPDNDGVFLMDLVSGESKLLVSIQKVQRMLVGNHPELQTRHIWFNHTVFNRADTRFLFLARSNESSGGLQTGMFTANLDGSDLRQVVPYGSGVSHFDWRNDKQIIATFNYEGGGRRHVLFTDGEKDFQVVGEGFLHGDGHCTFSPGQQWLATDQSVSAALAKSLVIFNIETTQGTVLGKFDMLEKRYLSGDLRCDLHPRWSRTGDAICIDAIDRDTGTRQLHIAHLDFA